MSRILSVVYGLAAYVLFLVAFLYAIGFVANRVVPKGIDDGPIQPAATAITIDVALLLLFAVQHNVMARPWFKAWWTRFVPRPIERSTYVAIASLILLLLYWQWRPLPATVWHIEAPAARALLWILFWVGWGIVLASSFLIDHFDLFGLRQVWLYYTDRIPEKSSFSERSLYRWVRHPLMLGFIVAFWSAPTMSQGRLLFAVVTTVWIFIAVRIEERDLVAALGMPYEDYRRRTPMLLPWTWPRDRA